MNSLIQSQWREHRIEVIWQDLAALTRVQARKYGSAEDEIVET